MRMNQKLLNKDINPAKRAVLVVGGDAPSEHVLKEALAQSKFLAAADSGAVAVHRAGLTPNLLVGDMDSVDGEVLEKVSAADTRVLRLPVEKDDSDTESAVKALCDRGFQEIILLGATGSRLDHVLGSVMLISAAAASSPQVVLWDANNCCRLIKAGAYHLSRTEDNVSVVPLSPDGLTLTLNGFYYPLQEDTILFGQSRGLSNVMVAQEGTISVHHGFGLLFVSQD